VDWIHVAQVRLQWWALVEPLDYVKGGEFFHHQSAVSFLRTLFHEVGQYNLFYMFVKLET
jgi:hypothetical protein